MAFFQDLLSLESKIAKLLEDNIHPEIIACYLSYITTGKIKSEYNNDLEVMLTLDCKLSENYGLTNLLLKITPKCSNEYEEPFIHPIPSFNLKFKNQNGLHPVIDHLYSHLESFHYPKSNLLDLYTDETFGKYQEVYKLLDIIPYTHNWYGFIYDTCHLFDNELFLNSLSYCKGLFVFSHNLKKKLETELIKHSIDISVSLFCFPVDEPKTKFKMGTIKNIISDTGLETFDIFSFYKTTFRLKDYNLFGMSKTKILDKFIINGPNTEIISTLTNILKPTVWNIGLLTHIHQIINSVKELEDFDLCSSGGSGSGSGSIVFCNITNGSVIRILNECIVRNIPIIINKHPAVVELLGIKYPLYFDECCEIVVSTKQIKKAHKYLKKLNKFKFGINTFLCTLGSKIEN